MKKVGILALQGDFEKHGHILSKLGLNIVEVRNENKLQNTDALIIPGGESTTLLKLFKEFSLDKSIQEYAKNKPIMGTCAGLIILSQKVDLLPYDPLGLIDIEVKRNAYGRQRESFMDDIDLNLNGKNTKFPGVFIRAPKISRTGNEVKTLAWYKKDIVMVASKNILVATFHPELTDNTIIHQYFLKNFI